MIHFDFNALRLMVNVKVRRLKDTGQTRASIARELGMDRWGFAAFCTGKKKTLGVDNTMTVLHWLGHDNFIDYSDFVPEKEDL